ncbi:hypothetical protein TELCIR_06376 [Teladorsagia circumcincta]|uniref:ELMO domain-containing protein n=1 Tax=Teladorsagia circumcincta TaxID=45464 RepID=A0A2G9UPS8_TELCI|nr:hypothetical protein TELCIR_06376 [Teladorsagia circumcincta]
MNENLFLSGSDPATDFRGTGILGLIQLYCMARDLPRDFPLAVVGINITAILITRLRHGELHENHLITSKFPTDIVELVLNHGAQ